MLIGSHVSISGGLLGAAKEAFSYNANTFMVYTGAPQNTVRKPLSELKIQEGREYILLFLLLLCRGLGSEVSAVHYPDHFQLLPVHHCSSMFQMLLFYFSLPEQSLSIFYELNCKKRKGSVPFP